VDSYERAVEFPNVARTAYGGLGRAYFWSPDHDQVQAAGAFRKAVAKRRETLERSPNDAASWSELAYDLAMLDRREESLTALDRALRLNPDSPHYFYLAARIYNRLGDHERALEWLEKAVKGGYPRAEIRLSVEFDTLRGEPRFQRLLEAS
jgi:serine/threonine-protein kinase